MLGSKSNKLDHSAVALFNFISLSVNLEHCRSLIALNQDMLEVIVRTRAVSDEQFIDNLLFTAQSGARRS